ncbi:MAG: membrane protein insertase YidC [Saprospiraceae bacterium]|nr:membrane protein insertase YidC [Saprospiraceae bacterium]
MEEKQNNLSTFIGMGIIFLLLYVWMQYSAPDKEQPAQPTTPTPAVQQPAAGSSDAGTPAAAVASPGTTGTPDSIGNALMAAKLGPFAAAGTGSEQLSVLENDLVRVVFSNKGGRIREVLLKKYEKINSDTAGNDVKTPVYLLEDKKNVFELFIPAAQTATGSVKSSDLYFTPTVSGNTITFRADAGQGRYFEQQYTLSADNYNLDYKIDASKILGIMPQDKQKISLNWVNHLDKLEKNQTYERTMSSVYFKAADESPDYCNCRENDTEDLGTQPVQWFSHSNQFFNTSIIARDFQFSQFVGVTQVLGDNDQDLKILKTTADIPVGQGVMNMSMYTGPNEFDRLHAYDVSLEDIIPFGASIFGAINRWVIQPIFAFLGRFIGNEGIVILMLTLLVKLLLYPLTYKMVYSQARMASLKPQLEQLKKKHGGDQQAMSMETMKLYSEYKVNPLGGCLPILLQMPIWFALYRFFPAAIEFRQASFLWATDLSSYDVAMKLPFFLPGFGNHISAFTIIWVITTLWYTWYSMKQMDNSAMANDQMKMMKYMQYAMPVMFMFFFNNFASGLTLYLCFSNLLNIGQTVVTKQWLIDHEKIKVQLEINKNKPKKTGGFRERLENAVKEQQRVQEEKNKKKK